MSGEFSPPSLPISLGQVAARLGLELHGDPERTVDSVATLGSARPEQVSFLANPSYRDQLRATSAGAVIVPARVLGDCPTAALVAEDPYLAWARLLDWLHPPRPVRPGIDRSSVVAESARIDAGCEIGPLCRIGERVKIAAGCVIGPGTVIDDDVMLERDCRLVARVYLGPGCRLGRRVLVHPGAVIGSDGFGLAMDGGHWRKVPQIGAVRIGDDCEIGANTTIDRGAVDDTELGCDVRLDNQVQIAHNVRIGDHTAIAGCVGIAGSTRIGRYCMIAGASGIGGHLEICDHVIITAMSTVLDSIDSPGRYGSGIPARPLRAWQRILVRLGRLDRRSPAAGRKKN
ncbi:MAG: UDP-3-O-(3-hydroxymyristoyl)glucosamine N-acyltransferase [Wenzhouxiangellaceae bacterium]